MEDLIQTGVSPHPRRWPSTSLHLRLKAELVSVYSVYGGDRDLFDQSTVLSLASCKRFELLCLVMSLSTPITMRLLSSAKTVYRSLHRKGGAVPAPAPRTPLSNSSSLTAP